MAYINEDLKALGGGSGKAPALFMYESVDAIAEVSGADYFKDGIGAFEAEDIMITNTLTGGANTIFILICSTYDRQPDGNDSTITFTSQATFAGDVRATDLVGYQSDNMSRVIDGANGLFSSYTYRNNTDLIATILADDYFLEAGLFLEVGDMIYVIANDDFALLRVATATVATVTTVNAVIV